MDYPPYGMLKRHLVKYSVRMLNLGYKKFLIRIYKRYFSDSSETYSKVNVPDFPCISVLPLIYP